MITSYQDFFEKCSEGRLKRLLEEEPLSGLPELESRPTTLLMAYIDQSCLDLASKRLLTEEDLAKIDHSLLGSAKIQTMPELPMWFHFKVPQPVFGVESEDPDDSWADERVAACFFYAPFSTGILSRVIVPPMSERPFARTLHSPLWYEWRVDLIDPEGILFSAMRYYYDSRTSHWRKMEESTCPVDECTIKMDQELGYPSIVPCQICQKTLDYYSRWLSTCIHMQLGEQLYLKNIAWEIRKRDISSRTVMPGTGQKSHRKFTTTRRKKKR